jgi:hypothetical protein
MVCHMSKLVVFVAMYGHNYIKLLLHVSIRLEMYQVILEDILCGKTNDYRI